MQDLNTKQIRTTVVEMTKQIQTLGYNNDQSRIYSALLLCGNLQQRDIERIADLSQPRVSTSLQDLQRLKLVNIVETIKQNGKGRPIKIYGSIELNKLENTVINLYDSNIEMIEKFRNTCNGVDQLE